MRIHVLSTAKGAPTKEACLRSVRDQVGVPPELVSHDYRDAGCPEHDYSQLENFCYAISTLDPWDIVCLLDGDDELARPDALKIVWDAYHAHSDLWLTYGSYVNVSDDKRGISAPYTTTDYRKETWKASHLKTFRAGLFGRIAPESLKLNGAWIPVATDQAIMFPMLEMAGPEHSTYLPDVLYRYHDELASDCASPEAGRLARAMADYIRSMKPYERIRTFL